MGIRFLCPNGHKLNVKTELAGKRAICPDCGAKLVVPAAGAASESSLHNLAAAGNEAVSSPPASQPAVVWYVRPTSGGQFGPMADDELSAWIVDGRVTSDAYLWRPGWPNWRIASDAPHELPTPLPPTTILTSPLVADGPAAAELPTAAQEFGIQSSDSSAPNPEPQTLNPLPPLPEDLAALPRVSFGRRKHQTPIIVTILLVFTIVVLVGVLIWVIRRSGGSEGSGPQVQRIPVAIPGERS